MERPAAILPCGVRPTRANTPKTGWPPGLLQDDCRGLSMWFASRPDAKAVVQRVCAELMENRSK